MRTLFYVRSGYQVAGHHQAHYDNGNAPFAAHQVGMGHIVRCQRLAAALKDTIFLTNAREPGSQYLEAHNTAVCHISDAKDEGEAVRHAIRECVVERLIVDHMETNNNLLEAARDGVKQLVVIVGVGWSITERTRALADLIIFQGIGEPSRRVQEAAGGRIITGLDYVIVGKPAPKAERDGALVFMGGSIPWSYSVELCRWLDSFGLRGTVVAGWHLNDTEGWLPSSFQMVSRPHNLSALQASHKLQVSSMGMSVFEAMLAGTPVVCVSREKDHWASAATLDDAGLLVDCGLVYQTAPEELAGWAAHAYQDPGLLADLSASGRLAIDGRGRERVLEAMG